ncbi:MAG: PhzF family phenazine biosynthesis protein [Pikeienuella sp.]
MTDFEVERIAAFSTNMGGNPAGVVIASELPPENDMQRIAAKVGYAETAFAAPYGDGWRVRYFAPVREVPFCGHATIALGAALGAKHGAGRYDLHLNDGEISVEAEHGAAGWSAALMSPPTSHSIPDPALVSDALKLFGLTQDDLDPSLPITRIAANADMLSLPLKDRGRLSRLDYDQSAGAALSAEHQNLVGFYLVWRESERSFHVRMPFPSGGVFEDIATGAAAAAWSGWLRDTGRLTGQIVIRQGEDMGEPSQITAFSTPENGAPVRVSGATRLIR